MESLTTASMVSGWRPMTAVLCSWKAATLSAKQAERTTSESASCVNITRTCSTSGMAPRRRIFAKLGPSFRRAFRSAHCLRATMSARSCIWLSGAANCSSCGSPKVGALSWKVSPSLARRDSSSGTTESSQSSQLRLASHPRRRCSRKPSQPMPPKARAPNRRRSNRGPLHRAASTGAAPTARSDSLWWRREPASAATLWAKKVKSASTFVAILLSPVAFRQSECFSLRVSVVLVTFWRSSISSRSQISLV
mmetsp:Transcript_48129/g.109353  ORF Transcript_48129/g.109353 Transcript_48129/m.109353 type:complete len:251 (-) Transcript_48129:2764-3516(-)